LPDLDSSAAHEATCLKDNTCLIDFSFVTLSTLGYGDVLPTNLVGQNRAAMEAMAGQFFIAVVIARLVSV
jgi:hypothetical protein